MSKEIWGPKAWHLIHNFSIHSKNNNCMYTMIQTFGHILPCEVCKKHYNYIINDIYYLNEENVSKEIITKYLIDIHNMINEDLDKHLKMSFKNAIEIQKKTIDSDILFFIKIVYKQFDYINMSFFEFDKIYNFFICFVQNYPSKKINIILNDLISKKDFSDADTPMSFKKWFMKNFCTLHVVSTIQQSSFMKKKL